VREKLSGLGELLSGLFTRETLSEEDIARITERAREVTENIIGWFAGLPARIGEAASALVEAGRALIQSVWDGARERFGEFIDWVAGIPGRIIDAIGSIDLSSLINFGEPPRWLRWMMGDEEVTPPEIPVPPRQAEFDLLPTYQRGAAETLAAARAAGDLPTPEYLQDLSDYAGHLRGEMAGVQAQIDQIDQNGPMGDSLAAPLLANLGRLQEELVAVEADLDAGRARADEVTEALRILGETETTPKIDTASIDQALDRMRALRAEMAAAEGGAAAPVPSMPEIDGARAGGGPVSRDGTYLVGEEGPELVTPSRSGFVNTFGAIQDVVAAIQRLPSAVAAVQSIGPQLVTPPSVVSAPEEIEMPTPRSSVADAVDASGTAQTATRASFPKIDVQISIAPTIHTTERVDPAQLSRDIGEQMRSELREAFRGVFADTGMRFA
jgi:hypothetical protein